MEQQKAASKGACQFCGDDLNSGIIEGTGTYCCNEMEYFIQLTGDRGDMEVY